ncbi:hypothetical protein, conserved [Leishmania donovani]|uniref:Rab-GTPase-TBC domain containing protein, putative n=1 Tax=Leishmania donovani TaxID=5661 RepID=A0A3S7WUR8_LEIDO|nr:hypothetical protein, conserved [Leishmania donovani]AYU77924.1 Rab-GTPase-TBC domain containing protein, putative [Leishmania donovani]TPP51781.1 Rab-GTPase-TBC domain family protein [Leishmania donovani]CBZ33305.1 hypothetical protein, conserved [Leishmania donovani]
MNDLSFFVLQHQRRTLTPQLLRDTLDFAKPHAEEGALFSWRWHFFLGTLPLPAEDDMKLDDCRAACEQWRRQWQDAGRRLDQSIRESPRKTGKAIKFGESSSDSEDALPPPSAVAPLSALSTSGDGCTVNPLAPASESSYALQFQADMVRQTVAKDMSRLSWDAPPFHDVRAKETVADILLKYSLVENKDYMQGFHEIVAFLYYACYRDKVLGERFVQEHPALRSAAFFELFELVYADLPAAVYALFRRVISEKDGGMCLAKWYYSNAHGEQSGVVLACQRVQKDLLSRVDPVLQNLLDTVYGIESVVYLVRWLRLLFLREFPFEQTLRIWTTLFCERYIIVEQQKTTFALNNSIALYFAAQMLCHVHDALSVDAAGALQVLMKYPPTKHVDDMLYAAAINNSESPLSRHAKAPRLVDAKDAPALPAEVTLRQGEVLARVIGSLEQYWFPDASATAEEQALTTEMYVQSIAQLKKVRDVLLYGMGDEA